MQSAATTALFVVLGLISSVSCQTPGSEVSISLLSGGRSRSFRLFTPSNWGPASPPIPLILNFHGLGSNAAEQSAYSAMNAPANALGWAVAYPEGLGNSFNGGACCGSAASDGVNDVQFSRDIVNHVNGLLGVDDNAVFSTGMSNGGFMTNRNGCDAADLFTAIAPNAGRTGACLTGCSDFRSCNPSRPVPIVSFTGTSDLLVPYNGNVFLRFPSYAADLETRLGVNGCSSQFTRLNVTASSFCDLYTNCNAGSFVEFCTVNGGGHVWFNPPDISSTQYQLMRFAQVSGRLDDFDKLLKFQAANPDVWDSDETIEIDWNALMEI